MEEEYLYAQKLRGYQFRSKVYKLKYSEVFKVPSTCPKTAFTGHIPDPHESDTSGDDLHVPKSRPQLTPPEAQPQIAPESPDEDLVVGMKG